MPHDLLGLKGVIVVPIVRASGKKNEVRPRKKEKGYGKVG